jgi:aldehyde dehydrogenase (NAD+)
MNTEKLRGFLDKLDFGPAPESDKRVQEWLAVYKNRFSHFINGEWVAPSSGEYFKNINPATGEVLAEVALGNAADVNLAMKSAQEAFPKWSGLSGHERSKYLYAIARCIHKNARLFAVLESMDSGKTIRETRDLDIPLVIRHFYYCGDWAEILATEFPNYKPGGVVAQIIPWNFPFLMLAWKIAPAIAAGNTVVLKPSKFTPMSALMFAEMLKEEVGLPAGVVNIVTGDGGKTGELMINHSIPWKIAFTGSTEAGKKIREDTAGSGKKLTLELGGKSPMVVFANADLDSAIEGVVNAIFFNQGEVCCAGSRLLVEESIQDEFVRRLKVRMNKLRVGNPLDKAMDMGAINSADQLKKIQELVEIGVKEGAQMYQPENWKKDCPEAGYFYPPTLFTDVSPAQTIAQEEFFGPVLVCMSFRTPQEAVELANNTRYGLAASVWSQDVNTALDVARQLKAGTVWINNHNLFDASSGFGGYRESGYGREGGREGMLEYLCEEEPKVEQPIERNTFIPRGGRVDRTYRFYIGGKLVRPDGDVSFRVYTPWNEFCGSAPDANRKDVRNAVEAASQARDSWANTTPHLRAQILKFLAENLSAQKERFAERVGEYEVDLAVKRLFHYAAFADKFEGTVQPVPQRMLVNAVKEPIGVIGIRQPDDFPLLGLVTVLGSAMVMGNTVVLMAGRYPLVTLDFIQALQNSDVPAGVVNILSAENPDAIFKVVAEHEDVDAVWFFGSRQGSAMVERASVSNMKRTWVSNGKSLDWMRYPEKTKKFLLEATQIKNIWVPYGV